MAIGVKKVRVTPRQRRKVRIRKIVSGTVERPRLSVFKSSKYSYAQIISDVDGSTIVSASSKEAEVIKAAQEVKIASSEDAPARSKSSKSVSAAFALGQVLAKRAMDKKLSSVVFDRNGFLYHGRIKAIADGAREGGLKF